MLTLPLCMEFSRRGSNIHAFVNLPDATFGYIFEEIAHGRGWLGQDHAARLAGLSPSHFSREFSKRYKQSFREVQLAIRLELSALTLTLTSWRMTDIAAEFHYSHLKKWDHRFKKYFGVSPTAYRNQFRLHPQAFPYRFRFLETRAWREETACPGEKAA